MPRSPFARQPEPEVFRPMATRMQSHEDLLHATDTALRLVNQALGDLGTVDNLARSAAPMAEKGAEGSARLLNGLDRAIAVVTELEQEAEESQDLLRHARFTALREELSSVKTHAQVQIVTSHQLGYAAEVISETERRSK